MKNKKQIHSAQGFTLLEMVMVLAVIAGLIGLILPKGIDIIRNSRVQEARSAVNTLKTALADYITMPGGNGSIPRTEGPGIPCSGVALSGATDTAKGNGARLDAVFVAVGKLERPLSLRMGSSLFNSTGSGNEMTWSQASQAFIMTPDAVPLRNWSTVTRVEARVSNPALLPSTAQGANFRLDGVTDRSANVTIAYLVITGCPARDAYDLAVAMNPPGLAPVLGAACDVGLVAYATPVNGVTDAFIYLADL